MRFLPDILILTIATLICWAAVFLLYSGVAAIWQALA